MGVSALVLGIVALVLGFFGLGFPVGLIVGIVGIVLGAIGKKNNPSNGLATAGLVCAIIATALSVALYFACASCIGGTAAGLSSLF